MFLNEWERSYSLIYTRRSMEERVRELLKDSLKDLEMTIDSVVLEKENNNLFLKICLDSKKSLDLDSIVAATKIINPIMDKANLIREQYVLEVYGKSKGSVKNEEEN